VRRRPVDGPLTIDCRHPASQYRLSMERKIPWMKNGGSARALGSLSIPKNLSSNPHSAAYAFTS